MNIIRMLLDSLRIEDPHSFDSKIAKFNDSLHSERNILISIKQFWRTHEYNYTSRIYRAPSFKEIEEYARADVISYFKKPSTNEILSDFHLSKIRVTNWYNFFDSLFYSGYIRKATAKETLNTYTLKELKIIADSIGVKKSGKKSDLLDRIYDSLSTNELNQIAGKENLFIITEKGKEYLSYQEDLILLSSHYAFDVSLAEFNDKRFICGRKRNFYDTMFQALNEQSFVYQRSGNWNQLAFVDLRIYDIMIEESCKTEHNVPIDVALSHYFEYLYLMTCFSSIANSCADGICLTSYDSIILPKIKNNLCKYIDYMKFVNFDSIISNKPPSFLTRKEFLSLIEEIFNVPIFNYDKWNRLLQHRFKEYVNLFD